MDQWPIVGREALLATAMQHLGSDGAGLLLLGEAGVGKTRMAFEIAERTESSGRRVARIAGDETSSNIPLAGLSHLLPADLASRSMVDGQLDESAMFHLARAAIVEHSDGDTMLVVVDDANWLDELSLALVGQLARSGSISVVATVRGLVPPAGPLERMVRAGALTEILVPVLQTDDVRELLRAVLGPVGEGAVSLQLSDISGGNPLYIREMVHASIDAGTLTESNGRWTLTGPVRPSARLNEVVDERLRELSAEQRRALEAVALAGTIGVGVISSITPMPVLEELEHRGLLVLHTSAGRSTLRLSHPLYSEVLRAQLPELRARSLRLALSDALEGLGAKRREDAMRIASWRLAAGADVDHDLLIEAARLSIVAHDADAAERMARMAWEQRGDPESGVVLMTALYRLDRSRELEELGAHLSTMDLSDEQIAAVARQRAVGLFFAADTESEDVPRVVRDALAQLEPSPHRERLQAHHVQLLVNMGWAQRALDEADGLSLTDAPQVQVELNAAKAMALAMVGRTAEAIACSDEGFRIIEAHDEAFDQRTWLTSTRIIALTYAGRPAEAIDLLERARRSALARNATGAALWFSHWSSWVGVHTGDIDRVLEDGYEFVSWARERNNPPDERWGLGLVALGHLLRGEVELARPLVERAVRQERGPKGLFHPDVDRSIVWLAMADGRRSDAIERIEVSADASRARGRRMFEALSLYDLVRLGEPERVAERLVELDRESDSPLITGVAADATARVAGDADRLESAVDLFESYGFLPFASEAATALSSMLVQHGLERRATAALVRSDSIAEALGGLSTPPRRRVETVSPLTKREQELAIMAARGLTSKEIAAELVLSVRTVETHLQRSYMKLGIQGRGELADALGLN